MSGFIGDINTMNASIFGAPSAATIEYFRSQQAPEYTGMLGGAQSRFLVESQNNFERMMGAGALKMIDVAINQSSVLARPDVVSRLSSLADFQMAKPVMQAYIMANPVVRQRFHAGFCDGFSGVYEDKQPGVVGWGHKPYDNVMNGTMENTTDGVVFTESSHAFDEHGRENLSQTDWGNIRATWRVAEQLMEANGGDPTNPAGGDL